MAKLLMLLCFITFASAKICGPKQWEGLFLGQMAVYNKTSKTTMMQTQWVKQSLDIDRKQQVVSGEFTTMSPVKMPGVNLTVYNLYDKGIMYTDIPQYNTCTKSEIQGDVPDNCLSDTAVNLGRFSLGSQLVDMYKDDAFKFLGEIATVTISLTADKQRIPVSETIAFRRGDVQEFIAFQISNVTIGISDPKVFNVPARCTKL